MRNNVLLYKQVQYSYINEILISKNCRSDDKIDDKTALKYFSEFFMKYLEEVFQKNS